MTPTPTPPFGRPTTLTPERAQAIVARIAAGESFRAACAAAGVARSTVQSWRRENPMFDAEVAAAEAARGAAPSGRPTLYSEALAWDICGGLAEGRALSEVCADPGMPTERTVLGWLRGRADFRLAHRLAREAQADRLGDEAVAVARAATPETLPADRLAVATLSRRMTRLSSRRYG